MKNRKKMVKENKKKKRSSTLQGEFHISFENLFGFAEVKIREFFYMYKNKI